MTETFLYDTYALIELLNKNPNYEKYSTKEIVINGFIFFLHIKVYRRILFLL